MNAENQQTTTSKPVKEIPYSASRVYLPQVQNVDGKQVSRLPSGTSYVRMADGALRRVKSVEQLPDGSVKVGI